MNPAILLLAALSCLIASAASAKSLLAVQVEQEMAMLALQAASEERVAKLNESYTAALTRLEAAAKNRGDLEVTLAAKQELESQLGSPLSKSEMAALRPEIARLRSKYDAALVEHATTTRDAESKQLDAYADQLLALQTALTKAGELDTALEAQELHQQTLKQVEELRTSMPKQAAQADARADPSGARPEPGLPATGTVPLTPSAAKLTKIADSVKGKAGVQGAAPNVITFDGPSGDGRRGAKGILLKATSDGSGCGSTWAMDYSRSRSARGLQLIHPRDKGHAIVHINKGGIGISTPGEWIKVGYVGGSGSSVRKTHAFDNVFPLVDEQVYAIVSRMAHNGSCEVFIDGKLVATSNVRSAKPLSIEIPEGERFPRSSSWDKLAFKGDGLPMQWERNWAGVIVEPLDSGSNICHNLRYCHGIAEIPAPE